MGSATIERENHLLKSRDFTTVRAYQQRGGHDRAVVEFYLDVVRFLVVAFHAGAAAEPGVIASADLANRVCKCVLHVSPRDECAAFTTLASS